MTGEEKKVDLQCVCGPRIFDTEELCDKHKKSCPVYQAAQTSKIKDELNIGTEKEDKKIEEALEIQRRNKPENPENIAEIINAIEDKPWINHTVIRNLNIDDLRLDNDEEAIPSIKLFTIVPVRKPGKQEFFRVHGKWEFSTRLLEMKDEKEYYLVAKPLWDVLGLELRTVMLYAAINQSRIPFLIPVSIIDAGGRRNKWVESLLSIIDIAKREWVRAVSNMALSAYEPVVATYNLGEPEWPPMVITRERKEIPLTMNVLIETAFYDHIITDMGHPVVRQLLGLE